MSKYVKCNGCECHIKFGELFFTSRNGCDIYCSPHCFGENTAHSHYLNEDKTEEFCLEVFDDGGRKGELQRSIEYHNKQIAELQRELEILTAQN